MSMFEYYPLLSSANQALFGYYLAQWCKENNRKGVMLFDEHTIHDAVQAAKSAGGTDGIVLNILPAGTKRVSLHGLTLSWKAEKNKAILLEVRQGDDVIYTAPDGFFDACLWVGC